MLTYWKNGVLNTSVNEICKLSNVSKPAFYREFESGDNLMKEVLLLYQEQVLIPLHQYMKSTLEMTDLSSTLMKMIKETDRPMGCLYVKACHSQHAIGPLAKDQIKRCHSATIQIFRDWIEQLKKNDNFPRDVSTEFAASYLDSQINNASSMIAGGKDINSVKNILEFSLRSLF